jgi:hypothetical protein
MSLSVCFFVISDDFALLAGLPISEGITFFDISFQKVSRFFLLPNPDPGAADKATKASPWFFETPGLI